MVLATYIAFILISIGVLVFPGPSILLIVANSLQRGRVIGLYTVVGGFFAMLVQLIVAVAGLTSVETIFAASFDYVRWIGVVFLLYLGVQRWRGHAHGEVRGRKIRSYRSAVTEGFVVALTNPGTMLFFVAFFPQFLNANVAAGPQLLLMAVTFMFLTLIVDSAYALFAARVGLQMRKPDQTKARNRLAGAILLAAAVLLAWLNF